MQDKRVTQRDVARAAGVSRPTVSLALRHHPGIPAETRDRILKLAEKLGYVPDPVLSVLASYRWPKSSPRRAISSIGLIELRPVAEASLEGYPGAVRRGAFARAQALGFSVSVFSLPEYSGNLKRLLRVMRNRGISGVMLLPVGTPVSLDATAGWEDFSVVTATTSVLMPKFHRVIPDQLHNMTTLLGKMRQLGHEKIGAIFSEGYDERTTHAYSMALAWFGHRSRILILPSNASAAERDRLVKSWLRSHALDLVFAPDLDHAGQLPGLNRASQVNPRVRFVALGHYFEQFPELIGETAVRVLSGMMFNNETGIPLHPQTTTIDGAILEDLIPRP